MEGKNIKVLYIDDELDNLTSFKATFRRCFSITTAESAEAATKILEQETIHVILSDQRIQTLHPDPIRILITGYTDINAVIDAINRGQVYKYLTKPWSEEDVKIYVEKAYEVYRLRKENIELTDKLIDVNKKLEFLARQNLLS
jgi:response regulator RpfG family c-di-GMP phosphodiesterase